ncbi:MAG TPA: exodeoxyribonuclease V subunit gamma [Polyangia bacterium]
MTSVCYSNRLEGLVEALAAALPRPGRLFDGPWLVVSGRPAELFVDLALARQRGVSGNVDTMSVAGAFARLCTEAVPNLVLIERLHIVGELLALLAERPAGGDDALATIDAYLLGAGPEADAIDRRRVAVAQALASLFSAWSLTQPERLGAWRAGRLADEEPSDNPPLLRAERRLWTLLFGPEGRFARRGQGEGRRYLTLDAFLDERLDRAWRPPSAVHVFGLTDLPPGLQRPFDRLSAKTALSIYAFNPCREFWEDLETTRRPTPAVSGTSSKAGSRRRDSERQLELCIDVVAPAEVTTFERETPFLTLWGRPHRDTIRRLDALCESNADGRYLTVEGPPTWLARLQRDVLDREPLRTGTRRLNLSADGSLVILRAPEPRREWEAIAAEIWKLVRDDAAPGAERAGPPLRFSDIAVLIAGPDEPYLSLAPSVFHEANDLPHTLVDVPLAASSRISEAILGLLALPSGPLSRREVLDVVTHPNIKARFPDADGTVWLALCDALGIARGADRDAFADTYVERDAFNWDQGLRRLVLGRLATGPRSGVERPLSLPGPRGEEAYLPAEVAPDVRADADGLGLLVRSLLADVRFAREARLSIAGWIRFVHALSDAYLSTLSADDEAARLRVFAALDGVANAHREGTTVRLAVAFQLIEEALGGLRGTRGQLFGNGVTVGSLPALRSLPFRIIFVAGLGPERFPAADRPAPLDPGGPARAGEVTSRQRDRSLFLQALLAARERLYLSYVDREPLSGEHREPSAVLLELTETLRDGYGDPAACTRQVVVQRDQDPLARAAFPIAATEARARLLGQQIAARAPAAERLRDVAVERTLTPAAQATLAPLLGTFPHAVAAGRMRDRYVLTLSDLRRFLTCPVQGGSQILLGLRDVEDQTEARQAADEPFGLPRSIEWTVLGDLFLRAWTGAETPTSEALQAAYAEASQTQRLAHLFPAGPFAAATRHRHLRLMETWRAGLLEGAWVVRGPARELVFGRPAPGLPMDEALPALRIPLERQGSLLDVQLQGRLMPRLEIGDARGSLLLAASSNSEDDRDGLRPFLEQLLLAASDHAHAPTTSRHLLLRPSPPKPAAAVTELVFSALSPERARAYLTALVNDIFTGSHDQLFPCEAVFRARKNAEKSGDGAPRVRECIIETRDDPYYRRTSSARLGPVPRAFDYPPPAVEEAEALAERRFGLFFESRQVIKKTKEKA